MRQKVIIKLFIDRNDQRSRTKAFKIAVSQPGVESAKIMEGESYELEVVGQYIDAVVLTNSLRRKLGKAQLVNVGTVVAADDDDDNNGEGTGSEASTDLAQPVQPYNYPDFGAPQYQVYEVRDPNPECCSIM